MQLMQESKVPQNRFNTRLDSRVRRDSVGVRYDTNMVIKSRKRESDNLILYLNDESC